MKQHSSVLLITAATMLLSSCHDAPQVTPVIDRPLVERDVTSVEKNSRGNVLIPAAARVNLAGTPGVFVLKKNQARFRMIKTGKQQGTRIEVSSGLAGNERIIMGPYDDIYDGSPFRPANQGR